MASTLQQDVTAIQLNNYGSLVISIAVGYDYILTFSDEIEYIWSKPWTRVSTLYVLARYPGLCVVILYSLLGTSFLPGPIKTYVFMLRFLLIYINFKRLMMFDSCEILNTVAIWALTIFIGTADLAMILRVWLLYKKSIPILRALLVLYVVEMVLRLASCVMFQAMKSMAPVVTQVEVLDFSFCTFQAVSLLPVWTDITLDIVQNILAGLMCMLVGIQFARQSLQMYRATKRFEPGRYMKLFTREGIFYFVAILSYAVFDVLSYIQITALTGTWWNMLHPILQIVPTFTLTPRLILTLRKLYADAESRREADISTPDPFSSMDSDRVQADTSLFAHSPQCEGTDQGEGIQMVDREIPIAGPSRV